MFGQAVTRLLKQVVGNTAAGIEQVLASLLEPLLELSQPLCRRAVQKSQQRGGGALKRLLVDLEREGRVVDEISEGSEWAHSHRYAAACDGCVESGRHAGVARRDEAKATLSHPCYVVEPFRLRWDAKTALALV